MKLLITALAAVSIAAPVAAQDFKGPWVEARIGWDHVDAAGLKLDGFSFGGGAGYDFRLGKTVVAGLQAGISGSTARFCGLGPCVNADRDIEVLARIGTPVTDKSLLYALAGYSNAGISVPGLGSDESDGYRVGAGFEYAYNRHLFAKTEYRYTGYDFDISRHQVTVSLGYRF